MPKAHQQLVVAERGRSECERERGEGGRMSVRGREERNEREVGEKKGEWE